MKEQTQVENPKNWFQGFKMMWNNPRYKAIIKLGIYILFILLILLMIRNPLKNETKFSSVSFLSRYQNMDNYEYQYTLTINQNTQVARGIRVSDKQVFSINQDLAQILYEKHNYYQFGETGQILIQNPLLFSLEDITPSRLGKIIENATKTSTTTYETGEVEYIYKVPIKEFDETNTSSDNMILRATIEKNQITKVVLDLTDIQNKENNAIFKYELKLEYFHIGQMRTL